MSDLPYCNGCDEPLDYVDHIGTQHEKYDADANLYRPVGYGEGAGSNQHGLASRIDLCCGRCGLSLAREQRVYFYQRWASALAAADELRNPTMREVRR